MRINEYIAARFKTQREAAAFFGVTPGLVSHWMTGKRKPSANKALDIVSRTGGEVTLDCIFQASQVPSVTPSEGSPGQ